MGTSLAVQWLQPLASNAEGLGLIHGWWTKTLQGLWCCQQIKEQDLSLEFWVLIEPPYLLTSKLFQIILAKLE